MRILACLIAGLAAACASAPSSIEDAGVAFIPGSVSEERQPDGNTLVLETADGLVVVDTGRHADHVQKILDLAKARNQPVVAIFNTHWHLDHIGQNAALRAAYPEAVVFSNDPALTEALGAFLQRGLARNRTVAADPKADANAVADAKLGIAAVENPAALHPTLSIERSHTMSVGGRRIEVHLAQGASAGDVWLYDPKARLLIAGDLVTLPAPFLDTACPSGWRAEFDRMLKEPFIHFAPGHGRLMSRTDVESYRTAFGALLDCAAGAAPAAECASAWSRSATPLFDSTTGWAAMAQEYAAYYVENILRKPESRPAWCQG
jgi:glyoxylase-like metal-dependent hydrolase (beta-lactamase superfamily II)